jgi:hypothetical protein
MLETASRQSFSTPWVSKVLTFGAKEYLGRGTRNILSRWEVKMNATIKQVVEAHRGQNRRAGLRAARTGPKGE